MMLFAGWNANSQTIYKEKLAKEYFDCKSDSDCTLVSGWCSYFAINKSKFDLFNKIRQNDKSSPCPPGWVPMEMPKTVCIKKECTTNGGKPGL